MAIEFKYGFNATYFVRPTPTPTKTPTPTPSNTPTVTPTVTVTPTYMALTPTPTNTPTNTITPSVSTTVTTTPTQTVTPSITSTSTQTPTPTVTSTVTATATNTPTPTVTTTSTNTPTITQTSTPTSTVTPSVTATVTPTITSTNTPTPSVTSTATNTPTPSITATSTVTPTPSITPTNTPTVTITPTITPTPNIVTSGLVINLDAYNSTSYPGTGTTIYDLISSYTHTATNAPYTVLNGIKCFDCNGSSTVIEVNGTGPTLPTTGYTYTTWAKIKTSSSTYRTLFRTTPNDHPILVQVSTDNLGFWDNDSAGFIDSGYDVTSIANTWVQFTVVGDNTSSIFYINGTQVGSVAYGAGGNRHWAWGAISGQPFGYVANLFFYNRKLTLSEIQQNYDFLSPRFVEITPTPTQTTTSTPTPSVTPTVTITPTNSVTPTITPTSSITPTITPTLTVTPSQTPAASSQKRILFLGDGSVGTVATNVSTYLTNIGEPITYSAVTMSTTYAGAGMSTANYDAVVMYTNSSQTGAAGLSTALTNYVNSGGHLITGVFIGNLYPSGFSHSTLTAFSSNAQSNDATGNFTVSTATKITDNIGTTFGGFSFTNGNPSLTSGATLYASYTSGTKLLAMKTVGSANLISINTFFGSITSSSSTLCKMVGNSIMYATGVPIPTVTSFTSSSTWTAPTGVTSVDYLIVGGGGGGANGYDNAGGGGGGGGMVITGTTTVVPGNTYTVTVGNGGAGGANARTNNAGSDGQSSSFDTIVALGGGGGLGSRTVGNAGAAQVGSTTAATGGGGSGGGFGGKGGGGSISAGSANSGVTGGNGGSGTTSSFTLASITYGVGGAGGGTTTLTGTNGTATTGNGGKAGGATSNSSAAGGTGGSGIVVLRY